ncbi:MAG: MFS transporter, partial [Anaerolineae bacterium]|nr:MFS transporter [Anaerolineae bacterium]
MSAMFFVGAAFLIPVALMAQRLEEPRSRAEEHAPPLRLLARDPGLLALFATTFLVGCGEGVYLAYSGIFMDTLGGGELLVGAIFGLSAICELPTMPLSGRLARRIGKAQVLWLSYLVMALSYFGYALTRAPVVLLAFAMLKGVGFGLYGGIYVSLADERVPEVWSSTTQSILAGLSFGLAPLLSIPLLGWLSDVLGIAEIFWVAGALEFLAVLVMGAALLRRAFDTAPLLPSRAVD